MATAPQAAMEMPQQGENPYNNPETMAVYDEMRKSVSSKEFGDEMLASASQSDPQEVAKFRSALEQIDLPPEALDQLNNMVDEILANPQNYAEIRAKYMEEGATDDILPEQFDAQFFSALNMAIDQMIAEPAGVQAFAKGGIAELTPVAKAIASYGRNGDTMLAHITPAEARMLRRRGGSGTINPKTGLPEFFLKKLFKGIGKALKSIGNAVKDFAKSSVGKIITTVALGFFLGPAAASFVGATSAAGVAAVSGFVGSAGSTLLGGGNLKDALKAGAIGGLTAGATAGVMGAVNGTNAFAAGSYSGAGLTPSEAFQGQVDKFSNAITGTTPPMADVTTTTARDAAAAQTAPAAPAPAPGSVAPPADSFAPTSTQYGAFGEAPTGVGAPAPMAAAPAVGGTTIPASPADFGAQGPLANTSLGTVAPPVDASAATTSGNALAPSVGTAPPALDSAASGNAIAPSVGGNPMDATQFEGSLAKTAPPTDPSLWDKTKDFWNKQISPSGIQQEAAGDAIKTVQKQFPTATADAIMKAPPGSALAKAYSAAMPGMLGTYGPATALGIGAIGAFGGFSPKSAPVSPYQDLLTGGPGSARDLLNKNPGRYHVQNLPGVTYYDGSVIKPPGMAEGGAVTGSGEVAPFHFALGGSRDTMNYMQEDGTGDDYYARQQFGSDVFSPTPVEPEYELMQNGVNEDGTPMYIQVPKGAAGNAGLTPPPEPVYEPPPTPIYPPPPPTPFVYTPPPAGNRRFGINKDVTSVISPDDDYYARQQFEPDRFSTAPPPPAYTPPSDDPDYDLMQQGYNDDGTPILIKVRKGTAGNAVYTPPSAVTPPTTVAAPTTVAPPSAVTPPTTVAAPTTVAPPAVAPIASVVAPPPPSAAVPGGGAISGTSPVPKSNVSFASGTLPMSTSQYGSGITGLMSQMNVPAQSGGYSMPVAPNATPASQNLPELPQDLNTQRLLEAAQAKSQYDYNLAMNDRNAAGMPPPGMYAGGIAGLAQGGYPRRTGQISGPGTATSDSIPAMLSDGEFVMTAKAVRGAGKGDRRAGAKRMYALMNQLEKNAARG